MPTTSIDIPSLAGQTWLITGSTNGVGLETARMASRYGARVILAVRDTDRGRTVADELPGQARVVELDLACVASVRRAADELLTGPAESIDVLVNNAGVVTPRRGETADGFEMVLGVNALGPFHFTNLVVPLVRRRIVIVGSNAHKSGAIDFDDPHFRRRRWDLASAYAQSKLGDLLWGLALDQRLRDGRVVAGAAGVAGRPGTTGASEVDVQLTHPGWAATNISNATGNALLDRVVTGMCSVFAQPASRAALTTMYAATRRLPPCSYVGPDGMGHLRGMPTLIGRSALASDPALAEKFWDFAEAEIARVDR